MSTSKIIFGILGATAAGIAIGLLLAPEKGADMRKKISDSASDLASSVNDLIAAGKEKIAGVTNTVTKQADGIINDVTKRADRVKESVG